MMKNLNILYSLATVLLFLLICNVAYSQGSEITRKQLQDFTKVSGSLMTKSATKTIGSPYLSDNFLKGHIMLNEKARSETLNLKYNMEKEEVEYLRDKEIFVVDAGKISGFALYGEDEDILFRNGYKTSIDDINSNTLFRIVYEGKVKLLVNYQAKLHEDLARYSTATQKNKYNVFKKYYLVTQDGTFHKIESAKEDILDILADYRQQIETYCEKNNLNFEYERELISVLGYYDTISGN